MNVTVTITLQSLEHLDTALQKIEGLKKKHPGVEVFVRVSE